MDKILSKIESGDKVEIGSGMEFIESFRHHNVNKFGKDEFELLCRMFKFLMKANFSTRNL